MADGNEMESIRHLNDFFKTLTSTASGESSVDGENEVLYAKMAEVALSKIIGEEGCKYIMVTGSAAQNLRCVSGNDRGDIDLVLLSHHPPITQNEQEVLLIPTAEAGFYQIKLRESHKDTYPSVKRGDHTLLNAKSLRDFEDGCFSESLSLLGFT